MGAGASCRGPGAEAAGCEGRASQDGQQVLCCGNVGGGRGGMSRGILEAAGAWVIHGLQSRAWHSLGEDRTLEHEA